jgi:GT2 family glycosyltransferase
MKTSIVIITYNNIEYTKKCINSIRKYTNNKTYEIVVVDNNSTDNTVDWLKEQENLYKDIKCFYNEENIGFPGACNIGIKGSKNNDILLLNNDVIVTPNWLDNLNTCLYSDKSIGAVGATTNSCSNFQAILPLYTDISGLDDFAKMINVSDEDKWEERSRLIGFCLLIKREVIDKIGVLDERFAPGNYEDDDYSIRIRKAGYRLMLCRDVYIHHFGSVSFKKNYNEFNQVLATNLAKLQEKWGISYWELFEIFLHVPNFIDKKENEEFSLLYVGCKGANTLLHIKNKFKNARLYGIENNQKILINTDHFANIVPVVDEKVSFNDDVKFDYVLLREVNLQNTVEKIKMVKQYLNEYPKFIILASGFNIDQYKAELDKGLSEIFKNSFVQVHNDGASVTYLVHVLAK